MKAALWQKTSKARNHSRLGEQTPKSHRPSADLTSSQSIGSMHMGKSDPAAIEKWLKKRYKLLFLRINERTDHAFAIVDLPDLPPTILEQPADCRLSLSTPRKAESDFIRMLDFDQGTTFFNSRGWEKRLLEIARN